MKRLTRCVLSALAVLAFLSVWMAIPAFAAAGDPEKTPWLARLANDTIIIITPALTLLLGGLASYALHALARKLRVDVKPEWEAQLDKLVDSGIHYASEQARKYAKIAGNKMSQDDAKAHAIDYILDLAEDKKIVELGRDKLSKIVEARLNYRRPVIETDEAVAMQQKAHAENT